MLDNYEVGLRKGLAVAFDFDGVIHKYREGWKDGSIYDEENRDVLELIALLQANEIPCVIISTRDPEQIKEWWDSKGFKIKSKVIGFETRFYSDCGVVGITNRKIPAQLYIDDRAYKYTNQTAEEVVKDLTRE